MTVSELIRELQEYEVMGMGQEPVYMAVQLHYGLAQRTEPGDGIQDVYILDKDTP